MNERAAYYELGAHPPFAANVYEVWTDGRRSRMCAADSIAAAERIRDALNDARKISATHQQTLVETNLAHAAIEAAQAVIGQCDCIMHEMPDQDPKRAWYKARDAYYAATEEAHGNR